MILLVAPMRPRPQRRRGSRRVGLMLRSEEIMEWRFGAVVS
jgi:hypothetical protein